MGEWPVTICAAHAKVFEVRLLGPAQVLRAGEGSLLSPSRCNPPWIGRDGRLIDWTFAAD